MARQTLAEALAYHVNRIEGYANPLHRVEQAMSALAALQAAEKRIADEKRGAMMELRAQGWSLADIAGELDISRARVGQVTR